MSGARIRRLIHRAGTHLVLSRPADPPVVVNIIGKVRSYTAQELADGIDQGDRRLTISPLDLGSWPAPPKKGDRILLGSKTATVESVELRYLGDELVRYDLQIRGGV